MQILEYYSSFRIQVEIMKMRLMRGRIALFAAISGSRVATVTGKCLSVLFLTSFQPIFSLKRLLKVYYNSYRKFNVTLLTTLDTYFGKSATLKSEIHLSVALEIDILGGYAQRSVYPVKSKAFYYAY